MLHKDGYHKWTAGYDERGNVIEASYFDADGRPTSHKDGSHRWAAGYDERGNEIEQAYFDLDGKPFSRDGGYGKYLKRRSFYDERGRVVKIVYVDKDQESLITADVSYSTAGQEVSRRYTGKGGENLQPRLRVLSVLAESEAERLGVDKGDILITYNGKIIEKESDLDSAMSASGEDASVLLVRRGNELKRFEAQPGSLGIVIDEIFEPASASADLRSGLGQ